MRSRVAAVSVTLAISSSRFFLFKLPLCLLQSSSGLPCPLYLRVYRAQPWIFSWTTVISLTLAQRLPGQLVSRHTYGANQPRWTTLRRKTRAPAQTLATTPLRTLDGTDEEPATSNDAHESDGTRYFAFDVSPPRYSRRHSWNRHRHRRSPSLSISSSSSSSSLSDSSASQSRSRSPRRKHRSHRRPKHRSHRRTRIHRHHSP